MKDYTSKNQECEERTRERDRARVRPRRDRDDEGCVQSHLQTHTYRRDKG